MRGAAGVYVVVGEGFALPDLFLAEQLKGVQQVHPVVGLRLRIYLMHVGAGGGFRDEEFFGDVLGGAPCEQIPQDLRLPLGKPVRLREQGDEGGSVRTLLNGFLQDAAVRPPVPGPAPRLRRRFRAVRTFKWRGLVLAHK